MPNFAIIVIIECVIILQAAVVREMKSQGASKEAIDVEVKKLLGLKEKLGVSPAAAKGKKGKKNKAPKVIWEEFCVYKKVLSSFN